MNREILKGHLDMLLMATVHSEPLHGYALIEQLKRKSRGTFELAAGTVYPALYRLEEAGLLASRSSVHGGRNRRVYSITKRGAEALRTQVREWRVFVRGCQTILSEVA